MARRKAPTAATNGQTIVFNAGSSPGADIPAAMDEDEIQALDEHEDGELSRAISEAQHMEGARAEVRRVLPLEKKGYCQMYPVAAFSQERVQRDWGPGRYHVRFKGPGDRYIKGGGSFDIAEPPVGVTSQAPAASGVQDLISLWKEDRARKEADDEKRKGEWLEWGKILVPVLAPVLAGVIGQKGPSMTDLISAVNSLRQMSGQGSDFKTQFSEMIEVMANAREAFGDGGSTNNGSTGWDLLKEAIGAARPMIGKLAQSLPIPGTPATLPGPAINTNSGNGPIHSAVDAPRTQSAGTTASAPGQGASSPGGSSPQDGEAMFQQLQWLKGTVEQLMVQAEKKSNPRLYGEVVLDNLPPFIDQATLVKYLGAPNWWEQFVMLDKRVEPYRDWFTRFRGYVLRVIERASVPKQPLPPEQQQHMNQGEEELE